MGVVKKNLRRRKRKRHRPAFVEMPRQKAAPSLMSEMDIDPAQEMMEEGFAHLAAVMTDADPVMPSPSDSPHTYRRKRDAVINRVVPVSVVPLATANGMLVMGSGRQSGPGKDCSFPLPQYLTFAGATSLSLVMFGVTARQVLRMILADDRRVGTVEYCLVALLEYYCYAVSFSQAAILLCGAFYLYPNVLYVSMDKDDKGKPDILYCDQDMVMFTVYFLGTCWFFMVIGIVCYVYIRFCGEDLTRAAHALEKHMKIPDTLSEGDTKFITELCNRVAEIEKNVIKEKQD